MAVVTLKKFLKPGFIEKLVRNSTAVAQGADTIIRKRVGGLKGVTLKEFDSHPVTKELTLGPNAPNLSNTLNGVGNLFSFIGFYKSDNPVGPVRDILKSSLTLMGRQKKRKGAKGVKFFSYEVSFPSLTSFDLVSRMPWESGNSWVIGIERGISGFSHYMYLKYGASKEMAKKSRSGKGLQSRKTLNVGIFKPTPYITNILNSYRKRLIA
jgi:hypothetical protein